MCAKYKFKKFDAIPILHGAENVPIQNKTLGRF